MHVWFITSGVAGRLVSRNYKTTSGMLRGARKFLDNFNQLNKQTRDLEVYIAPSDARPFYNPYTKPNMIIKA